MDSAPETGDCRGRGDGHSSSATTASFPGFHFQQGHGTHRDELEYKRVLTRLQRRAPSPLPLNQITQNQQQQQRFSSSSPSMPDSPSASPQSCPARFGSGTASAGSGHFGWYGTGKDPIPLLTPLVSPTAGFQQQQQGICFGIGRHGD